MWQCQPCFAYDREERLGTNLISQLASVDIFHVRLFHHACVGESLSMGNSEIGKDTLAKFPYTPRGQSSKPTSNGQVRKPGRPRRNKKKKPEV
jgi:hypothetical protein